MIPPPPCVHRIRQRGGSARRDPASSVEASLPEEPHMSAAVSAHDLVKVYGAGSTAVRALDGVTVAFERGAFTAIMGPSGSGKSTLMHCLAGLDDATDGWVRLGDTELTSLSDRALTLLRRERIGFVFQAFNLLPTLTAEQNIRLPLELAGRRPDREWYRQGIAPMGLRDRLGHSPPGLSGAQNHRIAFTPALAPQPELVLQDGPTRN